MWQAWRAHGVLPAAGGWLDQPLDLWATIGAVELCVNTKTYMDTKGSSWSKLSPTQMALARWLESEND